MNSAVCKTLTSKTQLSRLADTRNISECRSVFEQLLGFVGLNSDYIGKALNIFDDIFDLYNGNFSGYKSCNTEYHDFRHVIDVTLASVRIADSMLLNGEKLSLNNIFLVSIGAIFHDTGYIPEISDPVAEGAVYTSTHVSRSMVFADKYMSERNYSRDDIERTKQMILATDLSVKIPEIEFIDQETERFAKVLATADLLGQMADRIYLEKLLFLYREFKTAGLPFYSSESDLLTKTLGFFKLMEKRFGDPLDGLNELLIIHFEKRYGISEDLYRKGMDSNIKYLADILEQHPGHHREYLRRDNIVKKL